MGRAKELYTELEENRYRTPRVAKGFVCAAHFRNGYLKDFINVNCDMGVCSYCGNSTEVMRFSDFAEYIYQRITDYLGSPDDEALPLVSSFKDEPDEVIPGLKEVGPYMVRGNVETYDSTEEMLADFELWTDNDRLNDDITDLFSGDSWIRKDPMGYTEDEALLCAWQNFCCLVKTKLRYTFFESKEYHTDVYGNQCTGADVLFDIASIVRWIEEEIPLGTLLYRGRPADDDETKFTNFCDLTAPPAESAKCNRMSAYGISMFYGSYDCETPLREIKNYLENKDTKIYVGEFKTKRVLKVVNLCRIPEPNFWMDGKLQWQTCKFLHQFHHEISKPIENKDNQLEYIPTQVFSEYLRFIQKTSNGESFDGIVYQSALTKEQNIVLFYDNKTSSEVLELTRVLQYGADSFLKHRLKSS